MSYWGQMARDHWQRHLPNRYAALDDPDTYFELLDRDAASYYQAIRHGLLNGINPNNGTVTWTEFLAKVSQADHTAHEIVATELIYLPAEDDNENDDEEEDNDQGGGPSG